MWNSTQQFFLANPRAERQDGGVSVRQIQITPVDISATRHDRRNKVLIMLGFFILGAGIMTSMAFFFIAFQPEVFVPRVIDSKFMPCGAIPVTAIVVGIILLVVGCRSVKREAMRRDINSRVAPPNVSLEHAQSFTTTRNSISAPRTSCGHICGSNIASGRQLPEATPTSTGPTFRYRPAIYSPTIYAVQSSDNAPPSYEAVMQKSISSSLV